MSDDLTIDLSNVLTFPNLAELKDSGGPVTRERRRFTPDECTHGEHGVVVNELDRTVKCKRCQKLVDPFEALMSLTRHWDWEHTRHAKRAAMDEMERVQKDLEELKAARAKVRRTGSVSVAAVNKVFRDLAERLKRSAAGCRAQGRKDVADAVTSLEYAVSAARSTLVEGRAEEVEGP